MKEVSRLLSISQLATTPYHSMCNVLVERFNGTLKTMLRRLCAEKPKQGDRYVNALLFAYREVPQESTGFFPFEVVFGRTVWAPMRILRHLWTQEDDDTDVRTTHQYVLELKERLEHTTQIAREELRKAQRYQKRHYDLRARQRQFETGDMVLVLLPTEANKLLMQLKRPYSVEERIGSNDYRINVKGKVKTYHVYLLRRYRVRSEELMPKADDNVRGLLLETVCSAYRRSHGRHSRSSER